MSKRCPNCGTDNPSDSEYCKKCAKPLYSPKERAISPTKTLKTPLKDLAKGAAVAGRYKLLENLGEGGMGTVFMAEQTEPVRRRVALKIIKLGMDTKQVVARFEAERQALAVMDHPNVAKVYDGGATETGRPYFVMEFVRGIPITEYCDKNKLSVHDRLKLFIPLCQAVQHAHQKGLIHRDLKPSNVLVTVQDGNPIPKIIDFGIAKATDHRLTQQTLFTEKGQLIGTPEYMSPEQAEMSGLDIDTRTDIYSLGVMLYELLVGVLPFDSKTLREAGFAEIRRIIQETDAPKASTRLSSLGDTRTSIARYRKTDPDSLHKELKGDLDWITMKAMAKDRTQRYASASELSSDITKHLKHEPILASPPSTVYRVKKYIKRHKTGVLAAGLVVLALVIGIAGTTAGLIKARKAEKMAKTEAATAQRVSNFLVDIFEVSDPSEAKGNTVTAREILDKGADKITAELQDQPATQARLMNTIGKVYMNLGLYTKSAPLLEDGLEQREKVFGGNHPEVADSLYSLSELYYTKAQYEEAKDLAERALKIREKAFGPEHLETAECLSQLGHIHRKMGIYDQAESFFTRSLEIREKNLDPGHSDIAVSLNDLAIVAHRQAQYDRAEPLYKRALKIWESAKEQEDLSIAHCMNNLGLLYYEQDKYSEAESLFERSLSITEKIYGPDHPEVGAKLHNLALLYESQRKFSESEATFRRSISIYEKAHGPDHPDVALGLDNLAILYCRQERFEESIPIFERALEVREKALGKDHPDVAFSLNNLAATYGNLGMHEKTVPLFKRALQIRQKAYVPDHHLVATSLGNLGEAYFRLREFEDAEPFFKDSLNTYERAFGLEHRTCVSALHRLATLYREWKRYEDAQPLYKKALEIGEKILPENHRLLADVSEDYAVLLREINQVEEAEKLEARARAIRDN